MTKFDYARIQEVGEGKTETKLLTAEQVAFLVASIDALYRGAWLVDGAKPSDSEWDEIEAFIGETMRSLFGGPMGARITTTGTITLSHNVTKILDFDSARWDTDNFYSAINPERLTAPDEGYYFVQASVEFAASATGIRVLNVNFSGGGAISKLKLGSAGGVTTSMSASTVYFLTAGQWVTVSVFQNSGADLDILKSNKYSPEFSIHRFA